MHFDTLHTELQSLVDADMLPGVATSVLHDGDVVDQFITGWADREAGTLLRADHLYRIFSNTKLVTSCAALMLWEEGLVDLDEPVDRHLPQLAHRRVLRPGAQSLDDTEPARAPITLRQLMTHTAGLSYGHFDPGTLLFKAYNAAKVLDPHKTLAQMMDALAPLPLKFHPGTQWEYSVATDVTARLVEVLCGRRFSDFIAERIFQPLGMKDTSFIIPESKQHRLCAYYWGAQLTKPHEPGLARFDDVRPPGYYLKPLAFESGGGGLISSLDDMARLVRAVSAGGVLLKQATLDEMSLNQLAPGLCVNFPASGRLQWQGFGLGSAVAIARGPQDPADVVGEFSWGGLGGTTWWINPRHGVAGVLMTQRHLGTFAGYGGMFKRLAYEAIGLR